MSFGNNGGEKDPVTNVDQAANLAKAYGYHFTVDPWVEGD